MDNSEKVVFEYLKSIGYLNPNFEPDGNIPPDFIVNSNIAIEVRRLNQNYCGNGKVIGLEETSIPLWHRIESIVQSIDVKNFNESWHVAIVFKRPLGKFKEVGSIIKHELIRFVESSKKESPYCIQCNNFEIELFRANKVYESFFVCSGQDDLDAGGVLLNEIESNIIHCVQEKSKKILNYKHKYDDWWLALVDNIGYDLSDYDRDMLKKDISIAHDWDKLIIINPHNITRSFEI